MRFDELDLFGDFKIKGAVGTSGQVLGVTQGHIGWITVTSGGGGGGAGAQGPDGPSPVISDLCQVVFGCGNSITSCPGGSGLLFSYYNNNFASQADNLIFINDQPNSNSTFLSTNGGYLDRGFNSIISSNGSICRLSSRANFANSIISSLQSCIVTNSSFICKSSIISSCGVVLGNATYNSVILSSCGIDGSTYKFSSNNRSVILSAYQSTLYDSCDSFLEKNHNELCSSSNSTVISGDFNKLCLSADSSIVGGRTSCIRNSLNSVIIGSCNSCIENSENTVILGGCGLTASGFVNTTVTQKLQKVKKLRLVSTTEPSPLEDGMIWFNSNKLWGRINGQTGTFSLIT